LQMRSHRVRFSLFLPNSNPARFQSPTDP
jgi:hypothetical protein